MNRKILFGVCMVCVCGAVFLVGCGGTNTVARKYTEVRIVNGSRFPKELEGRWVADVGGWEIEFDRDGNIPSIVHTLGLNELQAGQTLEVPLVDGGKGIIQPGKHVVEYDYKTRVLAVELVLDYFNFHKLNDILEGDSRDIFVGPVSEDGKRWTPLWQTFPNYLVTTDLYQEYQLPMDPESHDQGDLLFRKVATQEKKAGD